MRGRKTDRNYKLGRGLSPDRAVRVAPRAEEVPQRGGRADFGDFRVPVQKNPRQVGQYVAIASRSKKPRRINTPEPSAFPSFFLPHNT